MPKAELQAMTAVWIDLEKRFDAVVPDLYPIIMQFRNPQSGSWPRIIHMHEMLDERLAALGAPNAAAPAAVNDAEVQSLLAEIAAAKALSRRLSKQFWALAPKFNRVLDDMKELDAALAKVVKEKSSMLKTSNSVNELKKLRLTVNSLYVSTRDSILHDKLPKPDDVLLA